MMKEVLQKCFTSAYYSNPEVFEVLRIFIEGNLGNIVLRICAKINLADK